MTGHEIYNEGYEAGYEAAVAEFLEYGPATEDILDGFANFGSGFSKLFRGVRIRSISVQNMIRNGMSEKEAVSRMKELVAYLRRSELLKEDRALCKDPSGSPDRCRSAPLPSRKGCRRLLFRSVLWRCRSPACLLR